jgi:methionyl aminopeptidase
MDGYYSDTAASIPVPPVSKLGERLIKAAWEAQEAGLRAAKAGARINTIGRAYEQVAHRYGFSMIRELPGHGVGKSLHEPPTVPGFFRAEETGKLTEGMVVTFEPFVASGRGRIYEDDDGWTLRTTDGGLVAQVEHTVVITKGEPIILTVP